MYPENLNVIGQQTSEIFEFKKRLEERKEKKEFEFVFQKMLILGCFFVM